MPQDQTLTVNYSQFKGLYAFEQQKLRKEKLNY